MKKLKPKLSLFLFSLTWIYFNFVTKYTSFNLIFSLLFLFFVKAEKAIHLETLLKKHFKKTYFKARLFDININYCLFNQIMCFKWVFAEAVKL